MTMNATIRNEFNSMQHAGAAAIYCVVVGVLIAVVWFAAAALGDQYATVRAAENMLAQLEGRALPAGQSGAAPLGAAPAGSPFLEGQTVTVAGAGLLQRIGGAVSRVGGSVLSSQVELQRADAQDGWIGLVVSCDINLASLQQLLYDIEAGMPFIFIDQLVVQAPVVGVEKSQTRVLLAVSGQWRGRK